MTDGPSASHPAAVSVRTSLAGAVRGPLGLDGAGGVDGPDADGA